MSADLFKLDPILRQALAAELSSAERVVYIGRPDWRAETGQLSMIFLFGLCWFAVTGILWVLCLFGTVGIIPFKMEGEIAPWYVPILATTFMTPFVAGGGILMGIPIFAILKSRLSVHAITDQRIISVYAGYGCGVEAVPLTALNFVRRRDRRNGTGSLHRVWHHKRRGRRSPTVDPRLVWDSRCPSR